MDNLETTKYVITYLEQENKQLSDKQVFMELELLKVKRQSDKEALVTLSPIEKESEDDRETWLERVNFHLEKLLQKANRDNQMISHMAYHYRTRNKICNMRVKKMKARVRRDLKGRKRRIVLYFFLKLPWLIKMLDGGASHQFWSGLEKIFLFANFGNCTHRKSGSTRNVTGAALFLGESNGQMA